MDLNNSFRLASGLLVLWILVVRRNLRASPLSLFPSLISNTLQILNTICLSAYESLRQ